MKIKLTLLSDAIPGSGEGLAGIIDTDINYDEFGIPYIPAKRIKGILLESARNLEDVNQLKKEKKEIESFFGTSGTMNGTAFRISDGHIENYQDYRKFFKTYATQNDFCQIFNREVVLSYFTYTRAQTAMTDEGVAREHSLRLFRVLKKNLCFEFDVHCPHEFLDQLDLICKVTRHFGVSRTRGVGEIMVEFDRSHTAANSSNTSATRNGTALQFFIHNTAQLLVTDEVGKVQETAPYIPGSFILGALANRFLETRKSEMNKFHEIFLSGAVSFSNAYPYRTDEGSKIYYYFPAPRSIVKEKDKNNYFELIMKEEQEKIHNEKKQTKGEIKAFVDLQVTNNKLNVYSHDTYTEAEYHHSRPTDKRWMGHAEEGDGEFFQFIVIQPNQHFCCTINGSPDQLAQLKALIDRQPVLYFGKSKTAQYGKCEVIAQYYTPIVSHPNIRWENDKDIVLTLVSDMILRNKYGFIEPSPEILKDEFIKYAKIQTMQNSKIEIRSFVAARNVGGYLGIWNMPKIQYAALASGSVVVLTNKTGADIPVPNADPLCFGIRCEEGFGRVKINWHGDYSIGDVKNKTGNMKAVPASQQQVKHTAELIEFVLNKALKDSLQIMAIETASSYKAREKHLPTNSFIGRMMLVIARCNKPADLMLNFKGRAEKQLEKMNTDLYLMIKQNDGIKYFLFNQKEFLKIINTCQKNFKKESFNAMTELAGIKNFQLFEKDDDAFPYYKEYITHFLTLLRLYNRKEVRHAN